MAFWLPTRSEQDPSRFRLDVSPQACVGPPDRTFLMGGVGMAAGLEALQAVTERPLRWATGQFQAGAGPDRAVDIEVVTLAAGRSVTQASATLRQGERTILTIAAALGDQDHPSAQQFLTLPDLPPPEACPVKVDPFGGPDSLLYQFDRRTAAQSNDAGMERLWFRPLSAAPWDVGQIAIVADFLLGAHTVSAGGTSLDNTLRVHGMPSTEWVLADTQISGWSRGFVHGATALFSMDGTLIATGSQTGILRRH